MKTWIGLAVGGAAVVALTWTLGVSDARWGPAVQAGATVVLVIVSGVYAYLTFSLIRAQERVPRLAAQEAAARELVPYLGEESKLLIQMARRFPMKESDLRSADEVAKPEELTRLSRLAEELRLRGIQLPSSLANTCRRGARYVKTAHQHVFALHVSLLLDEAAPKGAFYSRIREVVTEEERPEWDQLLEGEAVKAAQRQLERLAEELEAFLQHP